MKGIIKCSDGHWIFICAGGQQGVGDTTSEGQIELRSWWECRGSSRPEKGLHPILGINCEPQHAICFDFKNTHKLVSLFQVHPHQNGLLSRQSRSPRFLLHT